MRAIESGCVVQLTGDATFYRAAIVMVMLDFCSMGGANNAVLHFASNGGIEELYGELLRNTESCDRPP